MVTSDFGAGKYEPSFVGSNFINFPGPEEFSLIAQGIKERSLTKKLIKDSLQIT